MEQQASDSGNPVLSRDRILSVIKDHIAAIAMDIDPQALQAESSMRDLGLNSIDRVDVIVNTLETLGQNIPLVQFASARCLGDIARIISGQYVSR
jgi:polyketide biosynthesis acyl carrier protein